jgi:hypothetical protein
MKKSRINAPYLQVVQGNTPPDFTPPRPDGVSERDWLVFLHIDDILANLYDYWFLHGGPCLSDASLKSQGLIPADWSLHDEHDAFIHLFDAGPLVPTTP